MTSPLLIVAAIACFCFAPAVHGQTSNIQPWTPSERDPVLPNLIYGPVTNEICAITAPQPGIDEILVCIQATNATNWINRWVRPTNEIPCKVWVWNEKGDLLVPTNTAIQSVISLPRQWSRDTFPYKRFSNYSFFFDVNFRHLFCIFSISTYYDVSEGGSFTCKVAPLLYDAEPNPKMLRLVELPPVTNVVVLPRAKPREKTPDITNTPGK